jgi:hypothetical protein
VETDNPRPVLLIEVANDGIPHHRSQLVEVIRFGEDRLA